jgi:hypothetical protein
MQFSPRTVFLPFRSKYLPQLSVIRSCQRISPGPRRLETFRNNKNFYGEGLLSPHPNPKLEDHPLSAVRDCLLQRIL